MATEVSLSCGPAPTVDAEAAQGICAEVQAFLAETVPGHSFSEGTTPPAIALTVTKANERSLGLEVVFIAPDGSKTAGMPLSTAFFDRNSDEVLRRRFYESFFRQNPLPF